jgi:hypothetical protein
MGKLKYMLKKQPGALLCGLGPAIAATLVYLFPPVEGSYLSLQTLSTFPLLAYIGANIAFYLDYDKINELEQIKKQSDLEKKVEYEVH